MNTQIEHAAPRLLDTYGLTYAFTALFLVPGLFLIDRLAIEAFSLGYQVLIVAPFLLGPATVFALDSKDALRTVALRSAVLAPLVAFSGITLVFVAMMTVVIPISFFLVPENFGVLTILSVGVVVLLAAPIVVSLVSRVRERFSGAGLIQIVALVAALGVIAWMITMTLDPRDTLTALMRKDTLEHFVGAFTWYLPAVALAAGIWRRLGLV